MMRRFAAAAVATAAFLAAGCSASTGHSTAHAAASSSPLPPDPRTAPALLKIATAFNDHYDNGDYGPVYDRWDTRSQAVITRAQYIEHHKDCPGTPHTPSLTESANPGPHGAWLVHYEIGGQQLTDYWFYVHHDWRFDLVLSNPDMVHSGILPERCEVARKYLKESDGPACWWFYYDGDPIPDRPTDSLFHCVAIRGNPATRQLLGYLELFGAYRMLILLSSKYDGTDLFSSYAVEPTTGKELTIAPKLDFPAAEVVAVCSGDRYRHDVMVAAIDKMMAIAYPKRVKRERDAVLMDAIRTAVPQLGLQHGEAIGPDKLEVVKRLKARVDAQQDLLEEVSNRVANGELLHSVLQELQKTALSQAQPRTLTKLNPDDVYGLVRQQYLDELAATETNVGEEAASRRIQQLKYVRRPTIRQAMAGVG